MTCDDLDRQMEEALKATRPAPPAGWQARAVEALRATTPRRTLHFGRYAAVAVACATVAWLGLARLPELKASGLLDLALLAAQQAKTVHVTAVVPQAAGESVTESWLSREGLLRTEQREGGNLRELRLCDDTRLIWYGAGEKGAAAREDYMPSQYVGVLFSMDLGNALAPLGAPLHNGSLALLGEREEPDGQGETVRIAEVQWTVGEHAYNSLLGGLRYPPGEKVLLRLWTDPKKGRAIRMEQYRQEGGEPHLACRVQFEWDVQVPAAARQFEVPPGTEYVRDPWWESRGRQTLAEAKTRDWVVTLHALDVDRTGHLLVSVSRLETRATTTTNSAPPIWVEATGDDGTTYRQLPLGPYVGGPGAAYSVVSLEPESPDRTPHRVTLVIDPYARPRSRGETVTFRDLPLPARQDAVDLVVTGRETTRH